MEGVVRTAVDELRLVLISPFEIVFGGKWLGCGSGGRLCVETVRFAGARRFILQLHLQLPKGIPELFDHLLNAKPDH
jgi:hypothetical protein